MFEYNICTVADEDIFLKQCSALEKHISDIRKGKLFIDVDGSKVQEYFLNEKRLTVHNSIYMDEVNIKSEFDIEPFFPQ